MSLLLADQGVRGLTFAVISEWTNIFTFIFGGCCSNALTLEQLMRAHPHSGSLITFAQFLSIAILRLPKFLTIVRVRGVPVPWLKKRKIPLAPYFVQVSLFYAISLLNNRAFGYKIPMPVHIIFRSGGLVVSMVMGWLFAGKRYNLAQVASVLVVTLGVVLTTLSASTPRTKAKWPPSSSLTGSEFVSATGVSPTAQYATGIAILSLALVLGGALGLVQDWTYTRYTRRPPQLANGDTSNGAANGNTKTPEGNGKAESKMKASEDKKDKDDIQPWQESMFYLHFLGLPMFFFIRDDLLSQVSALNASTPVLLALPQSLPQFVVNSMPVLHPPLGLERPLSLWLLPGWHWLYALGALPSGYVPLALTTLTSVVCVAGVNRLTARVSSLTVTLVLVVRKAVSMVISVALFGAKSGGEVDAGMMWAGAAAVFLGTVAYALGSRGRGGKAKEKTKTKKD